MCRGKRKEHWHLPKEGMRRMCSWHSETVELWCGDKEMFLASNSRFHRARIQGNGECLPHYILVCLFVFYFCYICIMCLWKDPHFFSEYIVFCLITPKHFWRHYSKWNLQEMRSCVGYVYSTHRRVQEFHECEANSKTEWREKSL